MMYKIGEVLLIGTALVFLIVGGKIIYDSLEINGQQIAQWVAMAIIFVGVGSSLKKRRKKVSQHNKERV